MTVALIVVGGIIGLAVLFFIVLVLVGIVNDLDERGLW